MYKRKLTSDGTKEDSLSFEEFIFSKYESIPLDRRVSCVICKRATSTGYTYNNVSIHIHYECLSLILFYEFMNNLNITKEENKDAVSLLEVLDLQPILKQMTIYRNKCYSCDARNVYFKCAAEGCSNYMHLHCAGNGFIIVDTDDPNVKRVNYRFVLCQTHLKEDEINIVKCRFLSKLSLTKEYLDIHTTNNANGKVEVLIDTTVDVKDDFTTFKSLSVISKNRNTDTFKPTTRNSNALYSYNSVPKYQLKTFGKTVSRSIARSESVSSVNISYSLTNSQYMQSITTLMVEYNTLRRSCGQKNAKNFEWWHYDILFAKIRPDLFDDNAPNDEGQLYYMYNDIKDLLKLKTKCMLTDFKRIVCDNELTIQNVLNSILMQLNPTVDLEALYKRNNPNDNVDQHSNNDESLSTLSNHKCGVEPKINYCKPFFALLHLNNNKSAWFSFIVNNNVKTSKHDIVILEYIPLSTLEYEYCRRVIQSLYYLPSNKLGHAMVVPLMSHNHVNKNESKFDDEKPVITLNGYNWDLDPPLYCIALDSVKRKPSSIANVLVSNKQSTISDTMELCDLRDIIGITKQFTDITRDISKDDFVGKQAVALMMALNVVNRSISHHKVRLLERVKINSEFYNRKFEDKTHVEESKEIFGHMHRWSHFKNSFQNSIESFISSMSNNSEKGHCSDNPDDNIPTSNEYCSVCLMPELSHKHVLQQCSRCCMRVHHKCYSSYRPLIESKIVGRQEELLSIWFCEPCEFEDSLAPKCEYIGNSAVCCICCSSGGALKRVAGGSNRSISDPPLWIHLICAVFLMPNINCYDLYALSLWDIKNINSENDGNTCSICGVFDGYLVKCSRDFCSSKFHPMCAWIGGIYVEYSPLHDSSISSGMIKCERIKDYVFPAICLRPYCIEHTIEMFNKEIVQEQCSKRAYAYTHYLYNPDPFGKQRIKNRISLPLELVYSPVVIDKTGPLRRPHKNLLRHEYVKRIVTEPFTNRIIKADSAPPAMVSIMYGLPRTFFGELPRYGINAISNFLSTNGSTELNQHTQDNRIVNNRIKTPIGSPHIPINKHFISQYNTGSINNQHGIQNWGYNNIYGSVPIDRRNNNVTHVNINAMMLERPNHNNRDKRPMFLVPKQQF